MTKSLCFYFNCPCLQVTAWHSCRLLAAMQWYPGQGREQGAQEMLQEGGLSLPSFQIPTVVFSWIVVWLRFFLGFEFCGGFVVVLFFK